MNARTLADEVKRPRKLLGKALWKAAQLANAEPQHARLVWQRARSGPLEGAWLQVDARVPESQTLIDGSYDAVVVDALRDAGALKPDAQLWDVGAHVGYDSLLLAALCPGGRVHAFDPNPFNARRFRRHMERNPQLGARVQLHEMALSHDDGEDVFKFSSSYRLSSIGHLSNGGPPSERVSKRDYAQLRPARVSTRRIDSLLRDGLTPPDALKVDVEGAEVDVLRGATQLLREHRPTWIIEVHNIRLMFEAQQLLSQHDYELRFLDDPERPSSSRGFLLARAR